MEEKNLNQFADLSPKQYFDMIKEKKNTITSKRLDKIYENCLELANKCYKTGQVLALRKILFCLDSLEKEQTLIDMGITTFIYRDDIDFYIDEVAKKRENYKIRPVKNIELERYEREIPDEVVDIIEKTKDIFDQMYVVYTDYTGKAERQIEAVRKEKDPILFGTFMDKTNKVCVDRFYYLADWEDEFCDLTLDKMVNETSRIGRNIVRTINTSDDINDLRNYLNAHYEIEDGGLTVYKVKADMDIVKNKKVNLFTRVKTVFTNLAHKEK
ncbi:hypothetical protein DW886_15255 [Enterocloster aldenensis]|uniref:hypothetical protein n=1 Tax=Enterocloster aldenensis TaxID=358742 RepID=UPI000E4DDC00|nr:hypothetical protein DW886_15255 [Enterocloster aldenensis]